MSARSDIIRIYEAAVQASLPDTAVFEHMQPFARRLQSARRRVIVAIGKAAAAMAEGARRFCADKGIAVDRTFVVLPVGLSTALTDAVVFYGGHPIPNEGSVQAAQTVLNYVHDLTQDDVVLLLISGGGSALFELPVPDLSLAELQRWYGELLASGMPIDEVNALRCGRSQVKGGRLARSTEATVIQLLLSDVPGDDPAVIASGPGYAPETERCITQIVGSAAVALRVASAEAERLGYSVLPLSAMLQGDAAVVGRQLAGLSRRIVAFGVDRPIALLATGETTVNVTGSAKGGRNMHLALSAALALSDMAIDEGDGFLGEASLSAKGTSNAVASFVTIASLGTDGRDGPTDAAGAIVDGMTVHSLTELEIDARRALTACTSYDVLDAVSALYRRGPTGTNVNDLMIALIRRPPPLWHINRFTKSADL